MIYLHDKAERLCSFRDLPVVFHDSSFIIHGWLLFSNFFAGMFLCSEGKSGGVPVWDTYNARLFINNLQMHISTLVRRWVEVVDCTVIIIEKCAKSTCSIASGNCRTLGLPECRTWKLCCALRIWPNQVLHSHSLIVIHLLGAPV